jgi:hypothetical protein
MLIDMLAIMAPVFLCAAIGFAWSRTGQPYDSQLVSKLVMNIGAPCLIVGTLGKVQLPAEQFPALFSAALGVLLITAVVSALALKLAGLSLRAYLPSLTFPNTGNMGLPLCLFAFGDAGLAAALGYFLVVCALHFSLGAAVVSHQISLRSLLATPVIYAALIAVALVYSGSQLPAWLHNTVELLGGLSIPLMLITLGVSLHRLRVRDIKTASALAVLRLLLGLAVGLLIVELLALEGVVRGVVIIQSAMPAAVFNYLLAQRYQRSPEAVAGVVVVSTLLGFLLLPSILWLAL